MKKLHDIVKPFFAIIFGALLVLLYLNLLQGQGEALALGIIAIVMAAYYIAFGVITVVAGTHLPEGAKKILELISIVLFPLFIFVNLILTVTSICGNVGPEAIGPNGWIIAIFSMIASISMVGLFIVTTFVKVNVLSRLAFLFGLLFILVLLLDLLFDDAGDAVVLGNLVIVQVALYASFSSMLVGVINRP